MNDVLAKIIQATDARPAGAGWKGCCPAHADRQPSLSIGVGDDGRVLMRCFAGCSIGDVCDAIGIRPADLFADSQAGRLPHRSPPRSNATHQKPRKDQPPPETFATADDAANELHRRQGRPADKSWAYHDVRGAEVGRVLRWDKADGKTIRPVAKIGATWQACGMSEPRPLFGLPLLESADRVFVVEGEKCAEALAGLHLTATTSPHGSQSAGKADWSAVAGKDVCILPDADDSGAKYAADVVGLLGKLSPPPRSIRVVELSGLPAKGDVADWIESRDAASADDLRRQLFAEIDGVEPIEPHDDVPTAAESADVLMYRPLSVRELLRQYPRLRRPTIHGLLREGETMNIIAAPKVGKSWLVLDLAIAIATGRRWLGFEVEKGRVLVVDNELHAETSASRIPKVADARAVPLDEFADHVDVLNLRGQPADLVSLAALFDQYQPGELRLIAIDAFYKSLPEGVDENSNGNITAVYSMVDRIAAKLGAAVVLIHHSSKGSQSFRSITDVGSGAGAQSRAADVHLILRQHAEEGAAVLEAVARSWPPIEARTMRWSFPVWNPADDLDPADLRPERPQRRKATTAKEASTTAPVAFDWTPERFVEAFASEAPATKDGILAKAAKASISDRQADRLFRLATGAELLHEWPKVAGRKKEYATVPPPLLDRSPDPKTEKFARARPPSTPSVHRKDAAGLGQCARNEETDTPTPPAPFDWNAALTEFNNPVAASEGKPASSRGATLDAPAWTAIEGGAE